MHKCPILLEDSVRIILLPLGHNLSQYFSWYVLALIVIFLSIKMKDFSSLVVSNSCPKPLKLFQKAIAWRFFFPALFCLDLFINNHSDHLTIVHILDGVDFLILPQNIFHLAHFKNLEHFVSFFNLAWFEKCCLLYKR